MKIEIAENQLFEHKKAEPFELLGFEIINTQIGYFASFSPSSIIP